MKNMQQDNSFPVVAFAADQNYFNGLLVAIGSLVISVDKSAQMTVVILDGGIGDESYGYLVQRVTDLNKKVVFRRIKVGQELFEGCPIWRGNYMTYVRFLLPNLLPDLNYCIYCDVDFLWLTDVTGLWSLRCPEHMLQYTLEMNQKTVRRDGEWMKAHGFVFDPKHYVSGGLSIYNLDLMRRSGFAAKAFSFMSTYTDFPFPDQTVVNCLFQDDISIIDQRWQMVSRMASRDDVKSRRVALHMTGEFPLIRQVLYHPLTDTAILWHEANAMIRGISLWDSYRMFSSVPKMLVRRIMFNFGGSFVGLKIYKLMLVIAMRSHQIEFLTEFFNRVGRWGFFRRG